MKKMLATILLILLIISAVPFGAFSFNASAETSSYYTYSISNGEATITNVDESISGDITIPSSLGGYRVSAIDDWAFYNCSNLKSVTIPESVTSIGMYAFRYCSNLTSVTILDGITSIGEYAFCFCYSLTSVTIPYSVTTICEYAFSSCGLTTVTIPDSVTYIGGNAFSYCNNLASVTIPYSVTTICEYAFSGCGLTTVTIPDSVTYIGGNAFSYCHMLKSVYYQGSEQNRLNIAIDSSNTSLTSATWYYNSCIESATHTYSDFCDAYCNICGKKIYVLGDSNGDNVVNAKDCVSLMQYINCWNVQVLEPAADVNKDGKVNTKDYVLLIRYINGWDVELK